MDFPYKIQNWAWHKDRDSIQNILINPFMKAYTENRGGEIFSRIIQFEIQPNEHQNTGCLTKIDFQKKTSSFSNVL